MTRLEFIFVGPQHDGLAKMFLVFAALIVIYDMLIGANPQGYITICSLSAAAWFINCVRGVFLIRKTTKPEDWPLTDDADNR